MSEHVEEIVGQDSHEQPCLIGGKSMAARLVPTQRVLPLFDPILNVPTTVVHLDHLPGRKLGIGHDEPDPWEEFPIAPLDFGDHSAFFVPSLCLVPETNQSDLNPTLGRPPHRTCQIRVDESVQHRIGRKPDEVRDPFTLAILIKLGLSKSRVPRSQNRMNRDLYRFTIGSRKSRTPSAE